MKPIALNSVRTLYFAATAALAAAAICVNQAPGFIRAVATVGTETQLPLERIASDGVFVLDMAYASGSPRQQAAAGRPTATQLDTSKPEPAPRSTQPRLSHGTPGYRRTITDSMYWTRTWGRQRAAKALLPRRISTIAPAMTRGIYHD
jgi:hypothetical protein